VQNKQRVQSTHSKIAAIKQRATSCTTYQELPQTTFFYLEVFCAMPTKSTFAEYFAPAPEPPTELGRYRILSSTAGVRVSPLALGAMSIGDSWDWVGSTSKEQAFKLLDAFVEAGGNFIDTANTYHNEV
jgi:hypothetical protein